jgi:hypothetical protein
MLKETQKQTSKNNFGYATISDLRKAAFANLNPLQEVVKNNIYELNYLKQLRDDSKLIIKAEDFDGLLHEFWQHSVARLRNQVWIDQKLPDNVLGFNMNEVKEYTTDIVQPFAEKVVLKPGSTIAIHGDLHGSFFELLAFLMRLIGHGYLNDDFTVKDPNFYLFFLGDYTDRGIYGAEVVYTVFRLKLANPEKVFLVRGNHEDVRMTKDYGLSDELREKFGSKDGSPMFSFYSKMSLSYALLPVVLYLGSGTKDKPYYFQVCHGGMEVGFDPKTLLESNHDYVSMVINSLPQAGNLGSLLQKLDQKEGQVADRTKAYTEAMKYSLQVSR